MSHMNVMKQSTGLLIAAYILIGLGCARMPYTTSMVHQDQRVTVMLQREIEQPGYTHPVQIAPQQVATILRGFSLREEQRLPLRWFAEEAPPEENLQRRRTGRIDPAALRCAAEGRAWGTSLLRTLRSRYEPTVSARCHRRMDCRAQSAAPSDHRLLSCSAACPDIRRIRLQLSDTLDP